MKPNPAFCRICFWQSLVILWQGYQLDIQSKLLKLYFLVSYERTNKYLRLRLGLHRAKAGDLFSLTKKKRNYYHYDLLSCYFVMGLTANANNNDCDVCTTPLACLFWSFLPLHASLNLHLPPNVLMPIVLILDHFLLKLHSH